MFAGSADDADFLDAFLAGVKESIRFRETLKARFPGTFLMEEKFGFDSAARRMFDVIDFQAYCREGDVATMYAPNKRIDGLKFELVDGQWKVKQLITVHNEHAMRLKFAATVTAAMNHVTHQIEHGDFARVMDALTALTARIDPAFEELKASPKRGN